MKIIEFYNKEKSNQNGHMLDDILTWSDGALEMDHDWIQWTFPSNEPSMFNGDAPVMTREESKIFSDNPELRDNMKMSFIRFLKFLGMQLVQDDESVVIESIEKENTPWWLRNFNHNMLRVTRVMKSLRLTGLTKYSVALYVALGKYKSCVSQNTWQHWHDAVFNPLWES